MDETSKDTENPALKDTSHAKERSRLCEFPKCLHHKRRQGFCRKHIAFLNEVMLSSKEKSRLAQAESLKEANVLYHLHCAEDLSKAMSWENDSVDLAIEKLEFPRQQSRPVTPPISVTSSQPKKAKPKRQDQRTATGKAANLGELATPKRHNRTMDIAPGSVKSPSPKKKRTRRSFPWSRYVEYSWDSFGLGSTAGSVSYNRSLEHQLWQDHSLAQVPQYTPQGFRHLIHSLRPKTIDPPEDKPIIDIPMPRRDKELPSRARSELLEPLEDYEFFDESENEHFIQMRLAATLQFMKKQDEDNLKDFMEDSYGITTSACVDQLTASLEEIRELDEKESRVLRLGRTIGLHLLDEQTQSLESIVGDNNIAIQEAFDDYCQQSS